LNSAYYVGVVSQKHNFGGEMSEMQLEFVLKRGVVDFDSIEDAVTKRAVESALSLVKLRNYEEAVSALPPISFEWSWSNGDGDPVELFEDVVDFEFFLDPNNSSVKVGEENGKLLLSINVTFTVEIREDIEKDAVQNWLDENSMDYAGHISGGWSYLSDDGSGVQVI